MSIFKYVKEKPLTKAKLQQWIDADLNVLLIGKKGTGKTERTINIFTENFGRKWAFFNGSTTDPWTDLIGIPAIRESDGEEFIRYVRPEQVPDDIEGFYIDEINRAKMAVRNALLEVIQFKSINGRKFKKLRVVWSSINPDKEEIENEDEVISYDVEELDPAMWDRFHIWFRVTSEPDENFFKTKYNNLGINLVSWWNQQPKVAKNIISPRRLEYLALLHNKGVDIADALPDCANIEILQKTINQSPVEIKFNQLAKEMDKDQANVKEELIHLLKDENKFEEVKSLVVKDNLWWALNFLNEDRIDVFFLDYQKEIEEYFYKNFESSSALFKYLERKIGHTLTFKRNLATFQNRKRPVKK